MVRPVAIVFFILSSTLWYGAAFAKDSDLPFRWSAESARLDAERAIANNKPFLYTSGGFICSPRYDSTYADWAKDLPVEPLACGCAISGLGVVQSAYAKIFNDRILSLLKVRKLETTVGKLLPAPKIK